MTVHWNGHNFGKCTATNNNSMMLFCRGWSDERLTYENKIKKYVNDAGKGTLLCPWVVVWVC